MAPSPQPLVSSSRLAWLGVGVTLLAYLARFGYGYGYSDQDDVLPFVMALGDGARFASDWFVQEQLASLNVRTYVAYGLWALGLLLPLEWAVCLVYIASFGLLASGLYRVYMAATKHQMASLGGVFVALVLTPQWTLGGNDLAHSMFVPSMLAWGVVLHGLHAAQRQRWGVAGVLVGLSVIVQALVGLQVGLVLGVLLLIHAVRERRWRPVVVFSGGVLLASSPMLVPLVGQVLAAAPLPDSGPSIRTILAEYRAPHHYLVSAFPPRAWLRFGLLLALGLGTAGWLAYRRPKTPQLRPALVLLAIVGGMLLGAAVFTLVWPNTLVLKLQLFKLTVLAKVVLIGLLAGGTASIIPAVDAHPLTARRTLIMAGLAALLVCGALLVSRTDATPWQPRMGHTADEEALMAWARAQTADDALVLVPPTWSGFRTQARRSAVVTIKGFPFTDVAMAEWYSRMRTIVPEDTTDPRSLTASVDAGYVALPAQALEAAADAYRATHVVTAHRALSSQWTHAAAFGEWHVHKRAEVEP
ncbi:MAG: DUF6798 domain-containing protein [Bacteroidota bacterium]